VFAVNINLIYLIMKKSILNIGKALNKAEQKEISGGSRSISCRSDLDCELTGKYCPGQVTCLPGFGVCLGATNDGPC
jgi:hypothetical protein